MSEKFNY